MNNKHMLALSLFLSFTISLFAILDLITQQSSLYAIIKGTPVDHEKSPSPIPDRMKDIPKNMGVVYLTGANNKCTGTLLNNNTVLTARHCVRTTNPGTKRINILLEEFREDGTYIQQNREVKQLVKKRGKGWKNDLALLSVKIPFIIDGKTDGYIRPLFPGYNEELIGAPLVCYGYGRFTPSSGEGKLRRALMKITDYDPLTEILYMFPNKDKQILTSGDSGSSCFHISPQFPLATIHHKSDKKRTPQRKIIAIKRDYESGPDTFRDWISHQILSDDSNLNFFVQIYIRGTRTIKGITYLPQGKEIPITVRAEAQQGISSVFWNISQKDQEDGSRSLIDEKNNQVSNETVVVFKTGFTSRITEPVTIDAIARDTLFESGIPGRHEARRRMQVMFVPADSPPTGSIEVKNVSDKKPSDFSPGKPIHIIITAQSDAGLFQIGYGIQMKNKNGTFHGGVAPGTRANVRYPRAAKKVTYNWHIRLSLTGSYRIYVYARDVLYGSGPGHQSPASYHHLDITPEKKLK